MDSMDFYGFVLEKSYGFLYGFLSLSWVSSEFLCLWISMGFYGLLENFLWVLWISADFYGFLENFCGFYGFLCVSGEFLRISVSGEFQGILWICNGF